LCLTQRLAVRRARPRHIGGAALLPQSRLRRRKSLPEGRSHLDVDVASRAEGADAMAPPALRPAEVVPDAELAADERRLFLAEPQTASLAGLADDGEISCRAEEDDRLLEQLSVTSRSFTPPPPGPRTSRTASGTRA